MENLVIRVPALRKKQRKKCEHTKRNFQRKKSAINSKHKAKTSAVNMYDREQKVVERKLFAEGVFDCKWIIYINLGFASHMTNGKTFS